MVVGIVLIGTVASVINKYIAARHGYQIEDSYDGEKMIKLAQSDDAALKRIEQLEKRVRVLERIATDDGARLKAEIEALAETRHDDLSEALSQPATRDKTF